ncbi:MAG: rhamnogalacturonan lyase B N-terminal domain-containing protein [Verrucomicrobiota bacterium]
MLAVAMENGEIANPGPTPARLRTLFANILCCALWWASSSSVLAAFGLSTAIDSYTVDTGAGLIFKVRRTDNGSNTQSTGDLMSLVYNGVEYQNQSRGSQITSGFDYLYSGISAVSVSAEAIGTDFIKITVTAGDLTHYYIARNGFPHIYMGTYFTSQPDIHGLVRYIVRIPENKLPDGPVPSDIRNTDFTVESGDIFGFSASHPNTTLRGQTRSKHYSNLRLKDWSHIGATGTNVGISMTRDNHEGGSGGPFYRSLLMQTGEDQEITYIVNYGQAQTEAYRTHVLNRYTLVFNNGSTPGTPDTAWFGQMNLLGHVAPADRGGVSCPGIRNRDNTRAYTIGFSNNNAQYWTDAAAGTGAFSLSGMIPGTYTLSVYRNELGVQSGSVTVSAGQTADIPEMFIDGDPNNAVPVWRIGEWDGTPNEFLNGDKATVMHPSDTRMADWNPGPYLIGTSSPETGIPCYQWKDINGSQQIQFNLSADQVVDSVIRVGITVAYSGARPNITVNSWTSAFQGASTQPGSRSLTTGSYRGNNMTYSFQVPASALIAGTNTLYLSPISGSGLSGFLSAGYSLDCIDMVKNPVPGKMPRAYVTFDESSGTNASDITGHGWDATRINGSAWTTGVHGNAADLDGVDDHLTLPNGVVNGLKDFTISTWVRLDALNTWSRIFDFGTGTSNYMFLSPQNGATGKLRFAITQGGGAGEQIIDGAGPLATGVWTHVAVTRSGTTGTLYVNGSAVGSNPAMTLAPSDLGSTTRNYIGRSQYPDPYLNGQLDEFQIFNRALSATELSTLASGPAAPGGIVATAITGQISLAWNPVAGATGYTIRRGTQAAGPFTIIATDVSGNSHLDTDVNEAQAYHYVISTMLARTEGKASAPASAAAPTSPGDLAAVAGDERVDLSWDAVAGATQYNVKRSLVSGGPYTSIASGITATTFADTGLAQDTTYHYVVSAVSAYGESADSGETSAHVPITMDTVAWYRFEGSPGSQLPSGNPVDAPFVVPSAVVDSQGNDDNLNAWWTGAAPSYRGEVRAATIPQTHESNTASLQFDGGDDVYSALGGPLQTTTFSNFTVEAYVRFTSLAGWQTIVGRDDNATQDGGQDGHAQALFYLSKSGANNGFRVELSTASGNMIAVNSSSIASTGVWYHVAAVGDSAAGTLTLFVNGAAVGSTIGFDGLFDPTADNAWTIGRGQYNGLTADHLTGYVDEVRISKVALSPDHFIDAPGLPGTPAGLSATAVSTSRIDLDWNAASGADSYDIKHSVSGGEPYTTIATGVTGLTYSATGLATGSTHFYVVSPVNSAGAGNDSPEAVATTFTGIEAWRLQHFGSIGNAGDAADDADPDADGTSNETEFQLDLDPHDGSSSFAATGFRTPEGFQLSWPFASGLSFEIRRSATMGAATWQSIGSVTGVGNFTDTQPPEGAAFYQILLLPD